MSEWKACSIWWSSDAILDFHPNRPSSVVCVIGFQTAFGRPLMPSWFASLGSAKARMVSSGYSLEQAHADELSSDTGRQLRPRGQGALLGLADVDRWPDDVVERAVGELALLGQVIGKDRAFGIEPFDRSVLDLVAVGRLGDGCTGRLIKPGYRQTNDEANVGELALGWHLAAARVWMAHGARLRIEQRTQAVRVGHFRGRSRSPGCFEEFLATDESGELLAI